jgi:hypothetical protein
MEVAPLIYKFVVGNIVLSIVALLVADLWLYIDYGYRATITAFLRTWPAWAWYPITFGAAGLMILAMHVLVAAQFGAKP